MHIFKHFRTITKHRNKVMRYCFKCGLIRQGLRHDLSKYGITEFFNGAKYYQGTKSPHYNERKAKGFSEAWMHHKGRNKHHTEYWIDFDPITSKYVSVPMPNRYIAESICDKIAATKVYNGKNFKPEMVLDYFLGEKEVIPMHERTRDKFEFLLRTYVEKGEKYIFKYMKKTMRNNRTDYNEKYEKSEE